MDEAKPHIELDAAGIFWVALCCLWTVFLATGMGFLWNRRNMPLLKIRGLCLSFSAILCLHVYWMAVQFASIVSHFPSEAQYWIMGIYLPFGIALFHASNSRFLHVAKQQKRFVQGNIEDNRRSSRVVKLGCFHIRLNHTSKILIFIGFGMLVQV